MIAIEKWKWLCSIVKQQSNNFTLQFLLASFFFFFYLLKSSDIKLNPDCLAPKLGVMKLMLMETK